MGKRRTRLGIGMALIFASVGFVTSGFSETTPLDENLKPAKEGEIANLFRDMGVIQRKAMNKEGRFLLSTFGSFDFSDGPYSNYSINLNPGYGISDFFEVYFSFAPAYIASARSIVAKIEQLTLADNKRATITAAKPQLHYGLEFLWAPAYGKDSLGVSKIIRSDTFFKLGFAQVKYDSGMGMKFTLGVGKTYFFTRWLGVRLVVNAAEMQTIIDNVKAYHPLVFIETGTVIYL